MALLSSSTQEAAARQSGLTSRTLRRYLRIPAFRDEYRQRRRELMTGAVALAQQQAATMVAVQVTIARDTAMPPSVRVSAASNVYDIAHRGLEVEDLTERIGQLSAEVEHLKELMPWEESAKHNGHRPRGRYERQQR